MYLTTKETLLLYTLLLIATKLSKSEWNYVSAFGLYLAYALSYLQLLLSYLMHYFKPKSVLLDSTKRPAQSVDKDHVKKKKNTAVHIM